MLLSLTPSQGELQPCHTCTVLHVESSRPVLGGTMDPRASFHLGVWTSPYILWVTLCLALPIPVVAATAVNLEGKSLTSTFPCFRNMKQIGMIHNLHLPFHLPLGRSLPLSNT